MVLLAGQVGKLVVAVDMHPVGPVADLPALQQALIHVRVARRRKQRRKPVVTAEDVVRDGARLDVARPATSVETYINLKAYWDVDTQNRASGMSAWFTLSFSPSPPSSHDSSPPPILTKSAPRN
jgi:hypothetical protein